MPAGFSVRGLARSGDSEDIQGSVALEQPGTAGSAFQTSSVPQPGLWLSEKPLHSKAGGIFITIVGIWESESGSRIQNPSPGYKIQAPGGRKMK